MEPCEHDWKLWTTTPGPAMGFGCIKCEATTGCEFVPTATLAAVKALPGTFDGYADDLFKLASHIELTDPQYRQLCREAGRTYRRVSARLREALKGGE